LQNYRLIATRSCDALVSSSAYPQYTDGVIKIGRVDLSGELVSLATRWDELNNVLNDDGDGHES
jgi:hypothetical protein